MAKKLTPLRDKVIVKPDAAEEKTKSGIVIPDSSKEKPVEGTVVAVGSGEISNGQRFPLEVKVGDRVIYSKYGPTEVKIDGEELVILNERDIFAIKA